MRYGPKGVPGATMAASVAMIAGLRRLPGPARLVGDEPLGSEGRSVDRQGDGVVAHSPGGRQRHEDEGRVLRRGADLAGTGAPTRRGPRWRPTATNMVVTYSRAVRTLSLRRFGPAIAHDAGGGHPDGPDVPVGQVADDPHHAGPPGRRRPASRPRAGAARRRRASRRRRLPADHQPCPRRRPAAGPGPGPGRAAAWLRGDPRPTASAATRAAAGIVTVPARPPPEPRPATGSAPIGRRGAWPARSPSPRRRRCSW